MIQSYLLDEHISPVYRATLARLEPELLVGAIGDATCPRPGTADPDILLWCERRHFILVTHNRASMPNHLRDHLASGRHVPGILVVEPNLSPLLVCQELVLIARAGDPRVYADGITYIPHILTEPDPDLLAR